MTDHVRSLAAPATLLPGDNLYSVTGAFRLSMQSDGNLVLRGLFDDTLPVNPRDGEYRTALWASNTRDEDVTRCELQADGNFVLYDKAGNPRWASNTTGYVHLKCQDDGNVVLYSATGLAQWATNTYAGAR